MAGIAETLSSKRELHATLLRLQNVFIYVQILSPRSRLGSVEDVIAASAIVAIIEMIGIDDSI